MWIKSFGKINPILKIGENREDGFHNLFLIYQTISLYDRIKFDIKKSSFKNISIKCSNKFIPTDDRNLVYKVAYKLMEDFNLNLDINIFIEKNIPSGGGLGGGSSNAAVTINHLNNFCNLGLTKNKMMEFASLFGSDIPFFIEGGTALGVGRGEIIIPMRNLPEIEFLAVFPGIPFPTGKMYNLIDKHLEKSKNNLFYQVADIYEFTYEMFHNDFDLILKNVNKEIYEIFNRLKNLGYKVILSGSGSTFLIFSKDNDFEKAISILPEKFRYKRASTYVS